MTFTQFQITKLKARLEISQIETQLIKARHNHLKILLAYNERSQHVKSSIKSLMYARLEDAEQTLLEEKRDLKRAQNYLSQLYEIEVSNVN
jgi:hypothetical protein